MATLNKVQAGKNPILVCLCSRNANLGYRTRSNNTTSANALWLFKNDTELKGHRHRHFWCMLTKPTQIFDKEPLVQRGIALRALGEKMRRKNEL